MNIAELRGLLEKATTPRWQRGFAGQANSPDAANLVSYNGDDIVGVAHVYRGDNLALIVAAVNALPALLDAAEALKELVATKDAAGPSELHQPGEKLGPGYRWYDAWQRARKVAERIKP